MGAITGYVTGRSATGLRLPTIGNILLFVVVLILADGLLWLMTFNYVMLAIAVLFTRYASASLFKSRNSHAISFQFFNNQFSQTQEHVFKIFIVRRESTAHFYHSFFSNTSSVIHHFINLIDNSDSIIISTDTIDYILIHYLIFFIIFIG
ncbi:hypothetical protein A0U92_07230 [Acetobacter aceti]|uniref:Uncharacterized protein n=1 Tax=Acetobacter aceti TaxID=435 RepID=A0A1U9KFL7_ACEAC|nr:hypothetical protein A0U92_07230 [Acetobacter aceti]